MIIIVAFIPYCSNAATLQTHNFTTRKSPGLKHHWVYALLQTITVVRGLRVEAQR